MIDDITERLTADYDLLITGIRTTKKKLKEMERMAGVLKTVIKASKKKDTKPAASPPPVPVTSSPKQYAATPR